MISIVSDTPAKTMEVMIIHEKGKANVNIGIYIFIYMYVYINIKYFCDNG